MVPYHFLPFSAGSLAFSYYLSILTGLFMHRQGLLRTTKHEWI